MWPHLPHSGRCVPGPRGGAGREKRSKPGGAARVDGTPRESIMVKFVSAYKRKKAKEVERKKKQRRSPRFGQLALSQILLLRNQGKSYPEIARAAYVRKKDGSRANQQAVA